MGEPGSKKGGMMSKSNGWHEKIKKKRSAETRSCKFHPRTAKPVIGKLDVGKKKEEHRMRWSGWGSYVKPKEA